MESNALFKLAILPLAQGNSWNSRCFGVVSAGRAPLDEELQGRESEMVSLYSHQSISPNLRSYNYGTPRKMA